MSTTLQAQTIKQAKASYTARGRPSLSNLQQSRLKRDIVLEERARHAKDQEKRKAEAARRRAEKDRKDKLELDRKQIGSQRRCDRFGYKSSQFHLGAFMKIGNTMSSRPEKVSCEGKSLSDADDDTFLDDSIDDETLFDASTKAKLPQSGVITDILDATDDSPDGQMMPPPPLPARPSSASRVSNMSGQMSIDGSADNIHWSLEDCLADFDSSTQIARDLRVVTPLHGRDASEAEQSPSSCGSFGSFALSSADFATLEAACSDSTVQAANFSRMFSNDSQFKVVTLKSRPDVQNELPSAGDRHPAGTTTQSLAGFTLTQLENFIEDNLQLTQVSPG